MIKLRKLLHDKPQLTIDSVEGFQGSEREVCFMSVFNFKILLILFKGHYHFDGSHRQTGLLAMRFGKFFYFIRIKCNFTMILAYEYIY